MLEKFLNLLIAWIVVFLIILGLLWEVKYYYLELPIVKFSVSQQRVVAVENAEGKTLPLFPLPKKYEKIYVK